MIERWRAAVSPLVDGGRALEDVRAVSRHHRIQSTAGYDDAAAWLVHALRAAGLEPVVEAALADGATAHLGCPLQEGWACTRAVATLHGAAGAEPLADFAAAPLSLVQRSAPARGRWPLVPAGAADVRGRVVLGDEAVHDLHAREVLGRGAAGLVSDGRRLLPPVRTREHDRDSVAYTSFWWAGEEPRGWGFVVSPARGESLRARLAAGEPLEIEAEIVTRRAPTTAPIVTAVLPGTLPGEVLVTAHLCHPKPGANDNGSGVAAALEAARALAALDRTGGLPRARRSIRFLWMPELTGTYAWLAADPGRAARTVAALNLDMVGESQADCGSTQLIERAPHFAGSFAEELLVRIRHAAQDWVTSFSGEGHYSMVRAAEVPYSGGSDHAVWIDPAVGVPCPMLVQWPDRYYHSDLDTADRCDPASLAHAARIAAVYAAAIACAGADDARALVAMTARAARRRLLVALDAGAPAAAARAELLRGQLALASLARLADGPAGAATRVLDGAIPLAAEELEGFYESEIRPHVPAPRTGRVPRDARVPVRVQRSLLVPMRRLQPGLATAPAAVREAFLALDRDLPMGSTAVDLAWYACDGRRSVGEIAALLADEGCEVAETEVAGMFEATAALGASTWRDAATPGGHAGASREEG